GGGSRRQGGLAHLAWGEHVAELAAVEGGVQLCVCPALDVARRAGAQRPAGHVEAGLESAHRKLASESCAPLAAERADSPARSALYLGVRWSRERSYRLRLP